MANVGQGPTPLQMRDEQTRTGGERHVEAAVEQDGIVIAGAGLLQDLSPGHHETSGVVRASELPLHGRRVGSAALLSRGEGWRGVSPVP